MGTLTHKLQFNSRSMQGREFGTLETSERLDTESWGLQLLPVPQVPSPCPTSHSSCVCWGSPV